MKKCRVCGFPANDQFTVHTSNTHLSRNFRYCSTVCKDYDQSIKKRTGGLVIIFLSLGIAYITRTWVLSIFCLVGLGYIIYGKLIRPEQMDILYIKKKKKEGYKATVPLEHSDLPPEKEISVFEKEEKNVYSEILKKNVKECCYQAARLNDKYCICGRALEYPIESKKF